MDIGGATENTVGLEKAERCLNVYCSLRSLVAYVLERGLWCLVRFKDAVRAILEVAHAADAVSSGLISMDMVRAAACACSEEEGEEVEHYCMHCLRIVACATMRCWGSLLICQLCKQEEDPIEAAFTPSMSRQLDRHLNDVWQADDECGYKMC